MKVINSEKVAAALGPYSLATVLNDLVFTFGQLYNDVVVVVMHEVMVCVVDKVH